MIPPDEIAARLTKARADRTPISSLSAELPVTADRLGTVELSCV